MTDRIIWESAADLNTRLRVVRLADALEGHEALLVERGEKDSQGVRAWLETDDPDDRAEATCLALCRLDHELVDLRDSVGSMAGASTLYSLAARFGVNTNQGPGDVERDIVAMVETLKHKAREPKERCESIQPDRDISGAIRCSLATRHEGAHRHDASGLSWANAVKAPGFYPLRPELEIASIRGELAALGKHVEDVERRARALTQWADDQEGKGS
jgi:hypothetical protein